MNEKALERSGAFCFQSRKSFEKRSLRLLGLLNVTLETLALTVIFLFLFSSAADINNFLASSRVELFFFTAASFIGSA